MSTASKPAAQGGPGALGAWRGRIRGPARLGERLPQGRGGGLAQGERGEVPGVDAHHAGSGLLGEGDLGEVMQLHEGLQPAQAGGLGEGGRVSLQHPDDEQHRLGAAGFGLGELGLGDDEALVETRQAKFRRGGQMGRRSAELAGSARMEKAAAPPSR